MSLLGVLFWRATDVDSTAAWLIVGIVLGLAITVVPTALLWRHARRASARAEALAATADPEAARTARDLVPWAFE